MRCTGVCGAECAAEEEEVLEVINAATARSALLSRSISSALTPDDASETTEEAPEGAADTNDEECAAVLLSTTGAGTSISRGVL